MACDFDIVEFGGVGDKGDPKQAALAAGVSTGIGAIIPVIPFIFTTGTAAIVAAAIISLIAHFLVGAAMRTLKGRAPADEVRAAVEAELRG